MVGIELEVRKTLFDRWRTASGNASGKVNRLDGVERLLYLYRDGGDYIQGTTREANWKGHRLIGNFDISYNVANNERNALISLVFTYISRRIHTIGMLGFKDIVGEGGATLDFVSSYRFKNHFTVKLKASNLLNPSYRLTRERSGSDKGEKVVLNDYKKGMNLTLGISYAL